MQKTEPTITPAVLRPKQAAVFLSISPRKLWSMTASGEIPSFKMGGAVCYSVAALEAWINEQAGQGGRRVG